jgi:hypothetical protein
MQQFAPKNSNKKLVCTANVSPQGEILDLTCQDTFPVEKSRHRRKSHKESRAERVSIYHKMVNHGGYSIVEEGYYQLMDDIIYCPRSTNPSISILESNVTLDLNGFTLRQINKNVQGVVGIFVKPGVSNIIIKNGNLLDFSLAGIVLGNMSGDESPTIKNVELKDINVSNNGLPDPRYVILSPMGEGGLVMSNVENLIIEGSNFNGNVLFGAVGSGIVNLYVHNSHFDNTTNGNYQYPPVSRGETPDPNLNYSVARAFQLFPFQTIADIVIKNSSFNNTKAGLNCNGVVISIPPFQTTANVTLDSITVFNSELLLNDQPTADGAYSEYIEASNIGILIQLGNGITLNNCQVSNSTTNFAIPVGISNGGIGGISLGGCKNATVKDCIVENCTLTVGGSLDGGSAIIYAFPLEHGISNVNFINCSTNDLKIINDTGEAMSQRIISFYNYPGTGPFYFKDCRAFSNNIEDSNTDGAMKLCQGWALNVDHDILLEDCVSSFHTMTGQSTTDFGSYYSMVSGFAVSYYDTGSIIFRRCVASNNTDQFDGPNEAVVAGFSNRQTYNPGCLNTNFVFEDCIAEKNTSVSSTPGRGFDLTNSRQCKVTGCIADSNDIGIFISDYYVTTTIDTGSDGQSLPQSDVYVVSTDGFNRSPLTGEGVATIETSDGPQVVIFGDYDTGVLQDVQGGTGIMSLGGLVTFGQASSDNIISNNILQNNKQYGILDTSILTDTNAYYKNEAKNNGPTPTDSINDTNFSNGSSTISSAPIRNWILPGLPDTSDNNGILDPADNISIN